MPQGKNVRIYDKDLLKLIAEAQAGINPNYDPKEIFGVYSRVTERQSADFLEDYIAGSVALTPEALDIMSDYLAILKRSKYHRIVKSIKKAEDRYKLELIRKYKDDEKKKAFQATQFKILHNKKEAILLSSKDMLLIDSLLKNEKKYSTTKLKDKLRSFAMEKSRRTLRGEIPADEDFVKLVSTFGTYQQKQQTASKIESLVPVSQEKTKNNHSVSPQEKEKENKKQSQKSTVSTKKSARKGIWSKSLRWAKEVFFVAGLTLAGYFGGKFVQNQFSKADNNAKQNKTEVVAKVKQQVTEKVEAQKSPQTIEYSEAVTVLEKAYKNRFDTSLEIILGKTARDNLYQQIDKLAEDGKIEYKDGTTREWYAHAFTMYNQLAPNSKENKAVKNLLSGGNEDKGYIHSLVIQAGRDGRGIQASGTYSAFDNSGKDLQQQHLKNRKAVKLAEKAAMAKMQNTL